MKNTSHLIIGSNSFLGVAISNELLMQKKHVVGVYHKNNNNLNSNIHNIPISDWKDIGNNFDVVYIVSAYVPIDNSEAHINKLTEVNVDLVKTICKKFNRSKIIFCSSVSVYENSNETITETSKTNPNTYYGKSKLEGEHIVKQQDKYMIMRISSMYGAHMKTLTFLPQIIKSALKNKGITLFGDGLRMQNYIHVDDVAKYLIAASDYDTNETFLATGSKSFSNKVIAESIAKIQKEICINYAEQDDSNSYIYDNKFTNKSLGVNCSIDIETGLKQLITWMKKEL